MAIFGFLLRKRVCGLGAHYGAPKWSRQRAKWVDNGIGMRETAQQTELPGTIGEYGESAPAEGRGTILRQEGTADINAEMAEIGLSVKSGWYASVALYGSGGIVTTIAGLLMPETVPIGVTILGFFAILLAVLAGVGARYVPNADWATHMRLFFGLLIFLIGAIVAGDLRLAFVMLPLFVLITPTFLYGTRFAVPYVAVTTPIMLVVILFTPGAGTIAHAVFSCGAMLMITLSLMVAERRTRALARANRRLAYTDALTGIANMRRLRETLAWALGQTDGGGPHFALFAIDLDNFKLVNDTFDHTTGDAVLCAVAHALESEGAEDDLVARRGGDEFSVLVPRPDDVDLDRLATRLAGAIQRARLSTCPEITPSGSVAYVMSRPDDSISSVLQRADDELHESKRAFHAEHGERDAASSQLAADTSVRELRPRIADREAAMRSVSAAVSHAYSRPRRNRLRARIEKKFEDIRRVAMKMNLAWSYVAITTFPIGLTMALLSATGLLGPLPRAIGIGSGVVLMALSAIAVHAGRRHSSRRLIPLVYLVAIAAVSVAIAFAGETGTAILDVYVVLALFGFYFMRPRVAAVMLALCALLFVGFAVLSDFPFAAVRSAITVAVMLVAAGIIVKVRSVTLGFVRKNREYSEIDPLTGVANLRALKLRAQTTIERHQREGGPAVPMLMTVDLDRFKLVNDNYNHTVGDQMLEAVARAVAECVRIDEMVVRRGGDEFFVLFENTTPEHIESVIPRVREAVSHARARICPDLTPTASVGYVAWQPGQSAEEFLAAADGIMHDEKIETRARGYDSASEVEVA